MARSFISQLGQQTAESSLDRLHKVAQRRAEDLEQKPKRDTLNKFFPEDVSRLILQLPERDQWSAIQQLAQGYGQEQGGNEDMGLDQVRQQGKLGPQGPNTVDQQLQQAIGRESQGLPIEQQVQQPARTNQELSSQQQQPQRQRPTLGQALSGTKGNSKQQTSIDKSQSKWLETQEKSYKNAQLATQLLDEMDELWATGKVASGVKGYIPNVFQNEETQEFHTKSEELAGLLLQQTGVPTNMKIQFARGQKPNINQNKNTQKKLIDTLRKRAEAPLKMNQIKEELIAANDYNIPKGLNTKVSQLYSSLAPESESNKLSGLPPASQHKGEIFDSKDGSSAQSVQVSGRWVWELV